MKVACAGMSTSTRTPPPPRITAGKDAVKREKVVGQRSVFSGVRFCASEAWCAGRHLVVEP